MHSEYDAHQALNEAEHRYDKREPMRRGDGWKLLLLMAGSTALMVWLIWQALGALRGM